jgi:hypothetical protein
LLDYITGEFTVAHLNEARPADPLQIHAYTMAASPKGALSMQMVRRLSTDTAGVATALGLQEEARIDIGIIHEALESKMSDATLFRL